MAFLVCKVNAKTHFSSRIKREVIFFSSSRERVQSPCICTSSQVNKICCLVIPYLVKLLHQRCENQWSVVILDRDFLGFFGTGIIVDGAGTTKRSQRSSYCLKKSMKTGDSWSAQCFIMAGETESRPRSFLVFWLLKILFKALSLIVIEGWLDVGGLSWGM